jgi:hypothetical protein
MFEGFDGLQPPDQWDDITNRAAGPGDSSFEPRNGRRIAFVAAASAAVVGLAGVLWLGLGDSDDLSTVNTPAVTVPPSTAPATIAPPTSAPPTTVDQTEPPANTAPETAPPTTAPVTSATATTAPSARAFDCQESEIIGEPDGVHADDPRLDQFGPLGSAPALDIMVTWPDLLREGTDVVRVPGGVAVVRQARWPDEPMWALTVVNDEGTIRWRRCSSGMEVLGMFPTAQFLVLTEYDPTLTTAGPTAGGKMFDLSTGADAGTLELPTGMPGFSSGSDRFRLFGVGQPHDEQGQPQPGAADAVLTVLDTDTMATTEIPYPPAFYTGEQYADWIQLIETADSGGGWLLKQYSSENYPVVSSVFVDGTWSEDAAIIRSVVPVTAYAAYGMGSAWNGLDPLGAVIWTVPDRVAFWAEGPLSFEDGNVELLMVCDRYDPTENGGSECVSPALLGVDRDSGTTLWELPGHREVAAVGDGYALVSDAYDPSNGVPPTTWMVVDTTTGEPVDAQTWSYATFETNPYSMEDEGMWIRRTGGVVLAVNGQHIRVWTPASSSTGTVNVSLPI